MGCTFDFLEKVFFLRHPSDQNCSSFTASKVSLPMWPNVNLNANSARLNFLKSTNWGHTYWKSKTSTEEWPELLLSICTYMFRFKVKFMFMFMFMLMFMFKFIFNFKFIFTQEVTSHQSPVRLPKASCSCDKSDFFVSSTIVPREVCVHVHALVRFHFHISCKTITCSSLCSSSLRQINLFNAVPCLALRSCDNSFYFIFLISC